MAIDVAALIEEEGAARVTVPAHQGLVMCQVRETARNSRFYLGEALMTECRVRLGATEGLGAVLGSDEELARAMAVVDAAYSADPAPACLGEVDARIESAGRLLARRREAEADLDMASKVSFNEMGGQDMSVQAVVK